LVFAVSARLPTKPATAFAQNVARFGKRIQQNHHTMMSASTRYGSSLKLHTSWFESILKFDAYVHAPIIKTRLLQTQICVHCPDRHRDIWDTVQEVCRCHFYWSRSLERCRTNPTSSCYHIESGLLRTLSHFMKPVAGISTVTLAGRVPATEI
jgi:hypothetical protein